MLPQKIAFIDLETTGASFKYDRIIEIGILIVEDNKVIQTFNSLINPQSYLPPEIELLTGIKAADLESAPTFQNIGRELIALLEDCVIAAHNARFDYSFLKHSFLKIGVNFSAKQLCTVKLSRKLYPQYTHHNLDALIERLNFKCERRHRAFDDAKVLWQFYQKIQKDFLEEELTKTINLILKRPSVPINLNISHLDELPEEPGVYIFYGESEVPLYIGKSVNIRSRVLSHFSSDTISLKEMNISQQIKRIETIITTGELEALLKESLMIKNLKPLYNRQLRQKTEVTILKLDKSLSEANITQEYLSAEIKRVGKIGKDEISDIFGVFKSPKKAKDFLIQFIKENRLCPKLLGIEKGNGSCFNHQLKLCNGPCINLEPPAKYNIRFLECFKKFRINNWPFDGAVGIREISDNGEQEKIFVLDNWCFLGELSKDQERIDNSSDYFFDQDTYRILNSYFKKPSNLKKIILLPPY